MKVTPLQLFLVLLLGLLCCSLLSHGNLVEGLENNRRDRSDLSRDLGDIGSGLSRGFGDARSELSRGFGDARSELSRGFGDARSGLNRGVGDARSGLSRGFGDARSGLNRGVGSVKKDFDSMAPTTAKDRVLFNDHTTIGSNPLLQDEGDTQAPHPLDEGNARPPQAVIRGHNHEHPMGIQRSQIPMGDEDMYILKSEIVPPVCPACPSAALCPRQEPCPPCPACARCPEPAFDCKKVPNYRNNGDMYLPRPVLADFSQFGM